MNLKQLKKAIIKTEKIYPTSEMINFIDRHAKEEKEAYESQINSIGKGRLLNPNKAAK